MTVSSKINQTQPVPTCGIIMPISATENCSAEHWAEVLAILKDAIKSIGFEPNLVSDADEIGIIQKRIVQNIYNSDIVVCDVSAKNPNVMFELGMRLAFDRPTIIIKDDMTDYTFDTSVIEHLNYPRDLRFTRIVEFKEQIKRKIQATYKMSQEDPKYSTFLKNFGQYKIAHLNETEISSNDFILNTLTEIKTEIALLKVKSSSGYRFRRKANDAEKSRILTPYLNTFAEARRVHISELHRHLDELVANLSTIDEISDLFPSVKELRDSISDEIPPF